MTHILTDAEAKAKRFEVSGISDVRDLFVNGLHYTLNEDYETFLSADGVTISWAGKALEDFGPRLDDEFEVKGTPKVKP